MKEKSAGCGDCKVREGFWKRHTVMKLGEGSHVAVETVSYRVSESRSGTGTWVFQRDV